MKTTKLGYAAVATVLLICSATASITFWAWREHTFLTGIVAILSLFGGAAALPDRRLLSHSASLGLLLGFAVGTAVAIVIANTRG